MTAIDDACRAYARHHVQLIHDRLDRGDRVRVGYRMEFIIDDACMPIIDACHSIDDVRMLFSTEQERVQTAADDAVPRLFLKPDERFFTWDRVNFSRVLAERVSSCLTVSLATHLWHQHRRERCWTVTGYLRDLRTPEVPWYYHAFNVVDDGLLDVTNRLHCPALDVLPGVGHDDRRGYFFHPYDLPVVYFLPLEQAQSPDSFLRESA